jgi:hypothetical protein
LCSCFIDVFEFEILNITKENLLNQLEFRENWFISWISKELTEFQKFLNFINRQEGVDNNLRIFLDEVKEEIIELGRFKGFHSRLTYEKIKIN